MDEAPADRVGALSVEPVHPGRLPRELLVQKKSLDPEVFYDAVNRLGLDLYAFLIHEQGRSEPIACWFMTGSALYSGLLIDSFIVDKAVRTEARVRACMRLARSVIEQLCRHLGVTRCSWSTDRPDRMRELIGDDRVKPAETVLVFHVAPLESEE